MIRDDLDEVFGEEDYDLPDDSHDGPSNLAASLELPSLEAATAKKRKPIPKLDFERLMGPKGFKFLRQHMSNVSLCGKPEIDLPKVLHQYREWADVVFPKLAFLDVVKRIERLSKTSKSMRIYLRALREACGEGRAFDETEFMTVAAMQEADEAVAVLNAQPIEDGANDGNGGD